MSKILDDFIKNGRFETVLDDDNGDDNIYIYVRKFSDSIEYGFGVESNGVNNIVTFETEKINNRPIDEFFYQALDNLYYMINHFIHRLDQTQKLLNNYIWTIYDNMEGVK